MHDIIGGGACIIGAGVQAMWGVRLVASSHLYMPCEGLAQGVRLTFCRKMAETAAGRLGGGDGTTYSRGARMTCFKADNRPSFVRLYSLLCRAHMCEMSDWQGDYDDTTHHLAGLLACEALGQACKTHALQKAGKDSVHTCPEWRCSGPNTGEHTEEIAAPTVKRDI